MVAGPIDDIEAWSNKQKEWRQDCLRRLATTDELTDKDLSEILAIIKSSAGLPVAAAPPDPVPFTKTHFSGGNQKPIALKGIKDVEGVNRLVPKAELTFCPKALTVVYGRNGSGKSGFVRILRTACRTRIESPSKLKVLADVYGDDVNTQSAQIVVGDGAGETSVLWEPGMQAIPQLMQVSVFDTASAQLYVDEGNHIRFLPFGLALPHRLNSVCLALQEKLKAERAAEVESRIGLVSVHFPIQRGTEAQEFYKALDKNTTDGAIEKVTKFEAADQRRLDAVSSALSTGAAAVADVTALAQWTRAVAHECDAAEKALSDEALAGLSALKGTAEEARQAAQLAANELFSDDPLNGVGSPTWRALWEAARDFSVNHAYVGHEFPVTHLGGEAARCVLCQQPLQGKDAEDGAARMRRFQAYMDETLDRAATKAEKAVTDAANDLPEVPRLRAHDFSGHLERIRGRAPELADKLAEFQSRVVARLSDARARLAGDASEPVPYLASLHAQLDALAATLESERDALLVAGDAAKRQELVEEKAELEDRKHLASERDKLIERRNLLKAHDSYATALADVHTRGITQFANELLDKHLTAAVQAQFDAERSDFGIMHLHVGLSRKSGQTKAEFEVDPQSKITKVASDILSEGEQRALALAGFLTEVALTEGAGPIVVDDPVSSLDRDRGHKVAERLADEATKRQVVVFTHDIIFFNDLCRAAEIQGINPVTVSLFSDKTSSGKTDPSGMAWKGLTVSKRINTIKDRFAPIAKLHSTRPADYEVEVKNLYGRLRDTYERAVEEVIFHDVVRRSTDEVKTQELRYVRFSDALAIRFHEGMTKANTHSHDNSEADRVPVPDPDSFRADIAFLERLIEDIQQESADADRARPQMRPRRH